MVTCDNPKSQPGRYPRTLHGLIEATAAYFAVTPQRMRETLHTRKKGLEGRARNMVCYIGVQILELSRSAIAEALGVRERTVKVAFQNIRAQLQDPLDRPSLSSDMTGIMARLKE